MFLDALYLLCLLINKLGATKEKAFLSEIQYLALCLTTEPTKAADDYIKSAVVSEVDCLPAEIEVGSEGALVHYASETYYLERK